MYEFVEIYRCLATLIILNSHYNGVYPIRLDIGGELGLAMFFMLSGYLCVNIDEHTKFIPWYLKHILRLYIPFLIWQTSVLMVRGGVSIQYRIF